MSYQRTTNFKLKGFWGFGVLGFKFFDVQSCLPNTVTNVTTVTTVTIVTTVTTVMIVTTVTTVTTVS